MGSRLDNNDIYTSNSNKNSSNNTSYNYTRKNNASNKYDRRNSWLGWPLEEALENISIDGSL